MAAAASPLRFVGLVAQEDTEVLTGDAARVPLRAGQTIVANGTFTDGTATKTGIFLVLRQLNGKKYLLAPLGTLDKDWGKWLRDHSSVKAILWGSAKDPIPEDDELLRRWSVVAERGVLPRNVDIQDYGKKIVGGIAKQWAFLNDLVVADGPAPQAVTVPNFISKRGSLIVFN